MYKSFDKNAARLKRHLRSKVVGTSDCPRISIFRSNTNIYAQIIDDVKHVTLLIRNWQMNIRVELFA